MKIILILFSSLAFLNAGAMAAGFEPPDLLIETKLSSDWTGQLISKIRRLMSNLGKQDPFRHKFEEPIMIHEGQVQQYLNPSAKELLTDLGHALELNFLHAQTKVVVHGLRYDVKGFKTNLKLADEDFDGVTVKADFSSSKIRVNADKVLLSLILPGNSGLPVIEIEVVKPIIVASGEALIDIMSKIRLQSKSDKFQLKLLEANFDSMIQGLLKSDSVSLQFSKIIVPQVSLKVGNRTLNFDQQKIENLIRSKSEGIKGLLLAQLSRSLTESVKNDAASFMNQLSFDEENWISSTSVMSYLKINSFKSSASGEHVLTELAGDFCPEATYLALNKECINHKATVPKKNRLSREDHNASLQNMLNLVDTGEANFVVSISENYINKILSTTIDAGMWDEKLKSAGVLLGENKAHIRLDEKGGAGTIYVDLLYYPKKAEQMVLGSKIVRFPLILKVSLKISPQATAPIFGIFVNEIDLSDETLTNGRPEFGAISNIRNLRFKRKIIAKLKSAVVNLPNTEVVSLEYPALRGLDLHKVDFISDGRGRMNAVFLLKELDYESETE